MDKYGFKIKGDSKDGSPTLLECIFLAKEGTDLEAFQDAVIKAYNNPQRTGAPMSWSKVYKIE